MKKMEKNSFLLVVFTLRASTLPNVGRTRTLFKKHFETLIPIFVEHCSLEPKNSICRVITLRSASEMGGVCGGQKRSPHLLYLYVSVYKRETK